MDSAKRYSIRSSSTPKNVVLVAPCGKRPPWIASLMIVLGRSSEA
jgi:hypothetical protein